MLWTALLPTLSHLLPNLIYVVGSQKTCLSESDKDFGSWKMSLRVSDKHNCFTPIHWLHMEKIGNRESAHIKMRNFFFSQRCFPYLRTNLNIYCLFSTFISRDNYLWTTNLFVMRALSITWERNVCFKSSIYCNYPYNYQLNLKFYNNLRYFIRLFAVYKLFTDYRKLLIDQLFKGDGTCSTQKTDCVSLREA